MTGTVTNSPRRTQGGGHVTLTLKQRCQELWGRMPHGREPGTIADVWAREVESLLPFGRLFDGFVEYNKRVSPTCLVHLEPSRYSVLASFANRPVSVRVYPDRLVIAAEGQALCEHPHTIDRSHGAVEQTVTGATIWRCAT